MSELALQRIAENKQTQNPQLDLSYCDLTELPPELSECVWLTSLDLSLNGNLVDLSALQSLINLQRLACAETQVADLNPLSALYNLQVINCGSTEIADLTPLATLYNLQRVVVRNTPAADLTPLSNLVHLLEISCGGTEISTLTPLLGLKNLQELYFWDTQILDLAGLETLINLQHISFGGTQISDLTPLAALVKLRTISCWGTRVTDLSPLLSLSNLETFVCEATAIADLSPLSKLNNLRQVDCSRTNVTDLSPILHLIRQEIPVIMEADYRLEDNFIAVENCPLICPPVEIAQDSPQAVRDYFEELGDDGCRLNEVKVIFLGEASAGKTSLVKRLMDEAFDNRESQTHGIRIRKLPFSMLDGDTVTAHLWDFGGQEVMHATHQFFLSQRSVYVLLLNSRNDDQAEKWLKHAESFGGRSPVLVVLNKIDENPSFEVERKSLQEKYRQIRGFYRLSCEEPNNAGFLEFREALRSEIDRSDTRRTPFPTHWLAVKQRFEDMQSEYDYIESAEFQRVCREQGVTRPVSQDVLLQFLHDLGVVINFRNLQYFDTQILNPLWLTNGVYRIINSKHVADNDGLLREADFDAVINDPRYQNNDTSEREYIYPKNKLHYIVRVMREFELCFMLNECSYVVPQLLPANAPEFPPAGASLQFVIHFPEFLPNSVFPRLMVKLHGYIRNDERWRTGMVLHKPNVFDALARVRWDKEDQKLLIDVCGNERRRFLSFIRETVKEIVADFANLNFEERVPVPDCNDYQEYDYLVEAEKAGETDVFIKQLKKRIPISALLDGVEEPGMRDETQQLPVKAFVSYSHRDLEHLKALQSALAPLRRLQKLQLWDDRSIDAGDTWRKEIFQQLAEADIVLCLVSADFVNSDFCYQQEFAEALAAHRLGEKTIVPILLRETDWRDLPLAEIQGTPGTWISSAANTDAAWTEVSKSLRPALEAAKKRRRVKLESELR